MREETGGSDQLSCQRLQGKTEFNIFTGLNYKSARTVSTKTAQPLRLCLFEQYDFGTNDYYISTAF